MAREGDEGDSHHPSGLRLAAEHGASHDLDSLKERVLPLEELPETVGEFRAVKPLSVREPPAELMHEEVVTVR